MKSPFVKSLFIIMFKKRFERLNFLYLTDSVILLQKFIEYFIAMDPYT